MQLTNDFFNVENLDILTPEEKEFNKKYIEKLKGYADGHVEGTQIKNLTAGAATIAKRQQSRSAVAVLKFKILKDQQEGLIEQK